MESFLEFFSLADANVRFVLFGVIMLSASTAIVGSFTFLRKKALVGDAIAHAVLPGICLAFLLFETKNPFILLIGAIITGWFATIAIDFISQKTRIKPDAAIALVLSVFFGIGIFLLTIIQKSGNASQSGLDQYLFGKAASLIGKDVLILVAVAFLIIITVLIYFRDFTLFSFDENFAKSIGKPIKLYEFILSTLTVLTIAVGIQAVGVVLMAAMLITPAAAARYWTENIKIMVLLAVLFGIISAIFGAYISYIETAMPTGPWIIVVITFIAFFSIIFAPKRGLLFKVLKNYRSKNDVLRENILKSFYHIGEANNNFFELVSDKEILKRRKFVPAQLKKGLRLLDLNGHLQKEDKNYKLTYKGKAEGARIVRLHRLWELYLTKFMNVAEDHVHESAEIIEHLITPEIEAQLMFELGNPIEDPHKKPIPF